MIDWVIMIIVLQRPETCLIDCSFFEDIVKRRGEISKFCLRVRGWDYNQDLSSVPWLGVRLALRIVWGLPRGYQNDHWTGYYVSRLCRISSIKRHPRLSQNDTVMIDKNKNSENVKAMWASTSATTPERVRVRSKPWAVLPEQKILNTFLRVEEIWIWHKEESLNYLELEEAAASGPSRPSIPPLLPTASTFSNAL